MTTPQGQVPEAIAGALFDFYESTPAQVSAVESNTAVAALPDERAAFEARFPVPGGVSWSGSGYVAEDDYINSYRCDRFIGQWAAWQQARASRGQAPAGVLEDAARLDWLGRAGPTSICVVMDRDHDGEVEVSTDDVDGYGNTLREAIDAAMKKGANHE